MDGPGHYVSDPTEGMVTEGMVTEGMVTEGSPLYPEPIHKVFSDVPHQLCTFHIIKDLTKGILKA